jgi:rRNA maturation RNase YbeY
MLTLSISATSEDVQLPSEARLRRLAATVFEGEQKAASNLGIVFADHDTVLELNREWLEHDWHTDVISFLLEEEPVEGEVYVDFETAAERHQEFGATLLEELERYVVHGLLHLCGHDDATDEQRAAMRLLENRYLTAAGDGSDTGTAAGAAADTGESGAAEG